MYSEKVENYFKNPINMGIIKNADGIGVIENEICSDVIKIYLKVNENDIIEEASFEAEGCPPVIASCCAVTDMVKGMNIYEAKRIIPDEIVEKLEGLPKEKKHCAELVEETLKQAILNFLTMNS